MQAGYTGFDKRLDYLFTNATEVSYTQTLSSGTPKGEISIDGQSTTIYAPSGGTASVSYTALVTSGTQLGVLSADGNNFDIYAPLVSYTQTLSSGTQIGTLTIGSNSYNLYVPAGGSGGISDVYVNGTSVVDANYIAQIDLTGYATSSDLQSAVSTLQANFQAGVDAIYNACVSKGDRDRKSVV